MTHTTREKLLDDIGRLTWDIYEQQTNRAFAVRAARREGATWAQLGQALACSPQAAHRKYGTHREGAGAGDLGGSDPAPTATE